MSKKITLLLACCFSLLTVVKAQIPPNAFNYSAVARGPQGQPIASQNIGIRFSILKSSATGSAQYVETHQSTTDAFGLFNLVIGNGTIQSGNFGSITWEADNYFLKVELDAQGGINYFNMGTVKFLSVPYALYAKNSGGILGGTNIGITSISSNGDTLYLSNGQIFVNSSGNSNGIFISSISSNGDTLHLSNGQTFVAGGNTNSGGGTGNLVLPTITTNAITGITSNSATFGGTIINANANQIMERVIVYSTSPNPTILSNKIIIGSGIGSFDTISGLGFNYAHLLSSNTTYYIRAYAITENNISAYGNEVSFTTLSIGQTGPSGGIVFFDKGNSNGGWQYLECPSYDQSTGIAWGCHGLSIPGTQLTVGSGEANTNLIVA